MNKQLVGQQSQWLADQPSISYTRVAAELETSQKPAGRAYRLYSENQEQLSELSATDSILCQKPLPEASGAGDARC